MAALREGAPWLEPQWVALRGRYVPLVSILRVHRRQDSAAIARRMDIEVDGRLALRVRHGGTGEVEIQPGRHTVQARMDWHSSPVLEVTVAEGDTASVQVSYSFTAITKMFRRTDQAIDIKQV